MKVRRPRYWDDSDDDMITIPRLGKHEKAILLLLRVCQGVGAIINTEVPAGLMRESAADNYRRGLFFDIARLRRDQEIKCKPILSRTLRTLSDKNLVYLLTRGGDLLGEKRAWGTYAKYAELSGLGEAVADALKLTNAKCRS